MPRIGRSRPAKSYKVIGAVPRPLIPETSGGLALAPLGFSGTVHVANPVHTTGGLALAGLGFNGAATQGNYGGLALGPLGFSGSVQVGRVASGGLATGALAFSGNVKVGRVASGGLSVAGLAWAGESVESIIANGGLALSGLAFTGAATNSYPFPVFNLGLLYEMLVNGTWTDISAYVYQRNDQVITRGLPDETQSVTPSQMTLTLNNRDGRFSPNNPNGAYYPYLTRNVQLRCSITGNITSSTGVSYTGYRFWGELSVIPPAWDSTGNDVYCQVTVSGPLRRYVQAAKMGSALEQYYSTLSGDFLPYAIWPAEDGSSATQIASLLPDVGAMTFTGSPEFSSNASFGGSDPLPVISGSTWHGETGADADPPGTGTITQKFPGTYTWTCPPGVSDVTGVTATGGGGGGGDTDGTTGGGGGGGGGARTASSAGVTAGNSYPYAVGPGGAAGSGAAGGAGGNSYFAGDSVTVTGDGGSGGGYAGAQGAGGSSSGGGTGHSGGHGGSGESSGSSYGSSAVYGYSGATGGGTGSANTPTSQSTDWTVPAGVTSADVSAQAAGGGGGAGHGNGGGGAGGGAGGFSSGTISVSPGDSVTFSAGNGGAGGSGGDPGPSDSHGNTGGDSGGGGISASGGGGGGYSTEAGTGGSGDDSGGDGGNGTSEIHGGGGSGGGPGGTSGTDGDGDSGGSNGAGGDGGTDSASGQSNGQTGTEYGYYGAGGGGGASSNDEVGFYGSAGGGGAGGYTSWSWTSTGSPAGGGGGSSGGTSSAGNSGSSSGTGGSAPSGGGAGGTTGLTPAGLTPGGGGAGAVPSNSTVGNTAYSPGAGAAGQVTFSWSGGETSPVPADIVRFLLEVDSGGAADGAVLLSFLTYGTVATVDVVYGTGGTLQLVGYNSSSDVVFTSSAGSFGADGTPLYVSVSLTASGSSVDYVLTAIEPGASSVVATVSGSVTGTVGYVSDVYVDPAATVVDSGTSVGWITAQTYADTLVNLSPIAAGYAGETAAARVARLCAAQGLGFELTGSDTTPQMGPQQDDTFVNVLQSCADMDRGQVYETRDQFGIGYRTRTSMQAQVPAVIAYYGQQMLAQVLQPTADDQYTRNDITVTRNGGASASAALTTGPMSTATPPNGVGDYTYSLTVQAYDDSQLANLVAWMLTVGTVSEYRFPQVIFDMTRSEVAALFAAIPDLDIGAYIQIPDPPAFLQNYPIDQLCWGFTETLNARKWTIAINTVPEDPYAGSGQPTW